MRSHARHAFVFAIATSASAMACGGCGARSWGGPGEIPTSTTTAPIPTSTLSSAVVTKPLAAPDFSAGLDVVLHRLAPTTKLVFALPLPPGAVTDVASLHASIAGKNTAISTSVLVSDRDAKGAVIGVRSAFVELPSDAMPSDDLVVHVAFHGDGAPSPLAHVDYAAISFPSDDVIPTAERTIRREGDGAALAIAKESKRTLFSGREPRLLATFPAGYLAATRLLGPQVSESETKLDSYAGLRPMSEAFHHFLASSLYDEGYVVDGYEETAKDRAEEGSVRDPMKVYSAWLYDRCATFLTASAHFDETRFLRHAFRTCASYADRIDDGGHFTGKPERDVKYSHARGLYAYYALTGDPRARAAIDAITKMWLSDALFVKPYREGHTRGDDKLWTERLLGSSLEDLLYGFLLEGDPQARDAFAEMLQTAYRHVTERDPQKLAAITRSKMQLAPQGCFIHNDLQHAEGNGDKPWCSTWMVGLAIDPLLTWQALTNDARIDEIFVSLTRFLRDVGTTYERNMASYDDRFLAPTHCQKDARSEDPRLLVPGYGAGLFADGKRFLTTEGDGGREHCADATALTAAGIRALKRVGGWETKGAFGPFANEGESFLALHEELVACSIEDFKGWSRTKRDPRSWSARELEAGLADPDKFLLQNKIGWPSYPSNPMRKLSWWFNASMLQWALLEDANVRVPDLSLVGRVEPKGCP